MHNWTLAVLAAALFLWAVFSRRLEHSVITPAMFFVSVGLVFGPDGAGWVTLDVGGHELRAVAEITLTLVLFADASRLDLRALRHDYPLPARLLGVGLPLTIVLGTVISYGQQETGSWYAHSKDDRLWLDRLVLKKDDGELTSLNLDDYSHVEIQKT